MRLTTLFISLVTLSITTYISALPSQPDDMVMVQDKLPTMSTSTSPEVHLSIRHHLTNAERIQKGLPPNPPKRRSSSPTLTARQNSPSNVPQSRRSTPPRVFSQLLVETSDITSSGWVARTLDKDGRYFITKDDAEALQVVFSNYQLVPQNLQDRHYRVGATFGERYQELPAGPGNNAFEGDSYNYAAITGTDANGAYGTPAHKGATSYSARSNFIESAIYTLDPRTHEILPTWVNPDRTPRPSSFGISGGSPSPLFISMNMTAFNTVYGGCSAKMFLITDAE